ncbi:protein of unknown function [Enterobacter cancerogenus]|nr:protein of unknown function [Enterobacter cancerogenus]
MVASYMTSHLNDMTSHIAGDEISIKGEERFL